MRYSPLAAFAFTSAVVALPAPQVNPGDGDSPAPMDTSVEFFTISSSSFIEEPIFTSFLPLTTTGVVVPIPNPSYTGTPVPFPTSFPVISTPTIPEDSASPTATASFTGVPPPASSLVSCGEAFYAPDQYTCYDDLLCPVLEGVPTLPCGDACYLSSLYVCNEGVLESMDEATATGAIPTPTISESLPTFTSEGPLSLSTGGNIISSSTFTGVISLSTGGNIIPSSTGSLPFPDSTVTGIFPSSTGASGADQ
ncbi:MAG: hypothetical protein Q9170_007133 [Blastenia crenularia]